MTLTQKQKDYISFIKKYKTAKGYPPSIRDIADGFGGISTNAVSKHLDALQDIGAIKRDRYVARSIIVLA
jgi:repressor LexA